MWNNIQTTMFAINHDKRYEISNDTSFGMKLGNALMSFQDIDGLAKNICTINTADTVLLKVDSSPKYLLKIFDTVGRQNAEDGKPLYKELLQEFAARLGYKLVKKNRESC